MKLDKRKPDKDFVETTDHEFIRNFVSSKCLVDMTVASVESNGTSAWRH